MTQEGGQEEAKELLARLFAANQSTKNKAAPNEVVQVLRRLAHLTQSQDKGWKVDPVLKKEACSVLATTILDAGRHTADVRAHATGVLAHVLARDAKLVLTEQVADAAVAGVTSGQHLTQKKSLKLIVSSLFVAANARLLASRGCVDVLLELLSSTPKTKVILIQKAWAAVSKLVQFSDQLRVQVARSTNLVALMFDVLRTATIKFAYAKCSVCLALKYLTLEPEGALVAIANQVHLEMAETVDLCPSSILGSFWLHQSLAHLLKHDISMHELIKGQCLAPMWRYLLHQAKFKPTTEERGTMLKQYAEAVSKQRGLVQVLAQATIPCEERALNYLVSFAFMSPTKQEKRKLFFESGGIDVLLRALHDPNKALNVLTALHSLTFGDEPAYEGSKVDPPRVDTTNEPEEVPCPLRPVQRRITNATYFTQWRHDSSLADVAFVFPAEDDKEAKAHKLVLAAKSTVFNAMFTSGMRESHRPSASEGGEDGVTQIPLPNISSATFDLLLDYCYGSHLLGPSNSKAATGASKDEHKDSGTAADGGTSSKVSPVVTSAIASMEAMNAWLMQANVGVKEVAALLRAASQYEILDLEDACAQFIGTRLTKSCVMPALRLGLERHSPTLIFRCFEHIISEPMSVLSPASLSVAVRPRRGTTDAKTPESEAPSGKEVKDQQEEKEDPSPSGGAKPEWCRIRELKWNTSTSELHHPVCRRWLREFLLRAMLDVPQLEFVVMVGDQKLDGHLLHSGSTSKDSKGCIVQ